MSTTPTRIARAACAVVAVGAALVPAGAAAKVTSIATYSKPGALAAGYGYMALTQANVSGAQVLVGKVGEVPALAPKLIGVPSWARPHIGTTASGRVVLVYPTCSGGDCDLHAYDVRTRQDQPVSGAATPGDYELEGDLDRGALAVSVRRSEDPSLVTSIVAAQRLRYRPSGGALRTLTEHGGSFVELDRGRILTVRSVLDSDEGGGECGLAHLELTRTNGARERVGRQGCGESFQMVAGVGFVGRRAVAWGISSIDGSAVRLSEGAGWRRQRSVRALGGFEQYAPLSRSSALTLRGTRRMDLNPDPEFEAPVYTLVRVTGIQPGDTDASAQR